MYKDTDMFDHTNITLKNYKDLVFTRFKGVGLVLKIQFIKFGFASAFSEDGLILLRTLC